MNGPAASVSNRRNYPLLLASQFLSAFADNFILMLILGPLLIELKNGKITAMQQSLANIYYTSLLLIPYVLFAPMAGYLNDRFSKNRWLIGGNLIKVAGSAVVAMSIAFGPVWMAVGYFIVGLGACVYSPAKYGILPEILPNERLVKANGMMEMLTLVAILTGIIGGSLAFDNLPRAVWISDRAFVALSRHDGRPFLPIDACTNSQLKRKEYRAFTHSRGAFSFKRQ